MPLSSSAQIDIIFARGYLEGVSYVKMAATMPRLTGAEIEAEWQRLGLSDEDRPVHDTESVVHGRDAPIA